MPNEQISMENLSFQCFISKCGKVIDGILPLGKKCMCVWGGLNRLIIEFGEKRECLGVTRVGNHANVPDDSMVKRTSGQPLPDTKY